MLIAVVKSESGDRQDLSNRPSPWPGGLRCAGSRLRLLLTPFGMETLRGLVLRHLADARDVRPTRARIERTRCRWSVS